MTLGEAILGLLATGPKTVPQLAVRISKGSGREVTEGRIFAALWPLEDSGRVKRAGVKIIDEDTFCLWSRT